MKSNQSKILTFIAALLFVFQLSFSQSQLINIHPLVGDTITHEEAFTYYLFQNYEVTEYDYAMLYKTANSYKVVFYGDKMNEASIDSLTLNQYHENIEKIYQYLLTVDDQNNKTATNDSLISQPVNLKLMTPEQKSKMVKDAKLYNMKKLNADEQGLIGNDRDDYINTSGGYMWDIGKKKK